MLSAQNTQKNPQIMQKDASLVLESPDLMPHKHNLQQVYSAGLMRTDERVPKSDEELRLLNIRRKCERELIMQHDVAELNLRKDCWYLMDCDWLNAWASFTISTEDDVDPPGPLSTKNLLDKDRNPLPNLKAKIDYRGVSPLVYFIFLELYGRDKEGSPDICRYRVDIYMLPVPVADLVHMQKRAKLEAKALVNKIRPEWIKWELPDEEEEPTSTSCCCGYITREHIAAFIYWAIRCWGSKKKARSGIKYSQYRPLKPDADALLDSMSTHSNASRNNDGDDGDDVGVSFAEKSISSGHWLRSLFTR